MYESLCCLYMIIKKNNIYICKGKMVLKYLSVWLLFLPCLPCLSVCLSVCLVYLSVCLSACLFVCLSVWDIWHFVFDITLIPSDFFLNIWCITSINALIYSITHICCCTSSTVKNVFLTFSSEKKIKIYSSLAGWSGLQFCFTVQY